MSKPHRKLIPVSQLLLDPKNPRLKEEQSDQKATIEAVGRQQGTRLINIAKHIVEEGVDPLTLSAVVPVEDQGSGARYMVLEGNRRLAAIKAAETPALVEAAYSVPQMKKWNAIHEDFKDNPVHELDCVVFESEAEARQWVELRHGGEQGGIGLVTWGAEEKDRWRRRHGSTSSSGEVIDFVRQSGGLSEAAAASDKRILTNVRRLINTPEVRDRLGIEKRGEKLFSYYPGEEVAKGLTKIVEDLLTERIQVSDIYYKEHRVKYAEGIEQKHLPNPSTKLEDPVSLTDMGDVDLTAPPGTKKQKPRDKKYTRDFLIPRDCVLGASGRIWDIYGELKKLKLSEFSNSVAVMFRVFLELSADEYIDSQSLRVSDRANLANRLKVAAKHLHDAEKISKDQFRAVAHSADSNRFGASSVVTFHQYVHNPKVFPSPTELRNAWDQLQPFIEALWPRT